MESNHHHITTAGRFSRPVTYHYVLPSRCLAEEERFELSSLLSQVSHFPSGFRHLIDLLFRKMVGMEGLEPTPGD